jgi:hypothetical protein
MAKGYLKGAAKRHRKFKYLTPGQSQVENDEALQYDA